MSSILFSVLAALIAILAAGLLYGNDDTDHSHTTNPSAVWDTIKNNNNNNQVWDKPPECSNVGPFVIVSSTFVKLFSFVWSKNILMNRQRSPFVTKPMILFVMMDELSPQD
jgi:hypothetical protein